MLAYGSRWTPCEGQSVRLVGVTAVWVFRGVSGDGVATTGAAVGACGLAQRGPGVWWNMARYENCNAELDWGIAGGTERMGPEVETKDEY